MSRKRVALRRALDAIGACIGALLTAVAAAALLGTLVKWLLWAWCW